MGERLGVLIPLRRPITEAQRLLVPDAFMDAALVADETANAAWDRLANAALRAWTWRDPEALQDLLDAIAGVRPSVERDWAI